MGHSQQKLFLDAGLPSSPHSMVGKTFTFRFRGDHGGYIPAFVGQIKSLSFVVEYPTRAILEYDIMIVVDETPFYSPARGWSLLIGLAYSAKNSTWIARCTSGGGWTEPGILVIN